MSRHIAAAQQSMVPSWDEGRSRRVLERAVARRAFRSRFWRALAWSSAAATAVAVVRLFPGGIGNLNSAPSSVPVVQPAEPSTAQPSPSFTDGGGDLAG